MPDNPRSSAPAPFALPGHQLLCLAGRDAVAFAQAQFMNEVAALPAGHWQWNGWLTPKGRVVALFALLKLDVQTLWLLLPDADPAELAARLSRYVLRSKVALTVPGLAAAGCFAAPVQARGALLAPDVDGGVELDMGGAGGPRRLRIGGAPAAVDHAALMDWDRADLAHGLPRLPAQQAEHWTPQQLSLERLHAYSVKKGCYPGQEIVARTHFLGQAKRGLARFHAHAPVEAGAAVEADGRGIGTVVCARGPALLAVVALEAPGEGAQAGGVSVAAEPLLDGLAR